MKSQLTRKKKGIDCNKRREPSIPITKIHDSPWMEGWRIKGEW